MLRRHLLRRQHLGPRAHVNQHNGDEGAAYTRRQRPVELVWSAEFQRIDEAFAWEKQALRMLASPARGSDQGSRGFRGVLVCCNTQDGSIPPPMRGNQTFLRVPAISGYQAWRAAVLRLRRTWSSSSEGWRAPDSVSGQ
ncbi:GIY-YIG nuclease family protein [Nocardioides sp. CF8]|uniref:GIY-YIG nuclease family protein n=1 Tax=Nocardioides sp. CF8 TaxID=110319 RepID=UPI003FA60103